MMIRTALYTASIAALTAMLYGCLAPCPYRGTAIVSPSLKANSFSLTLMLEAPDEIINSAYIYHSSMVSAFMRNGYKVVERVHAPPFDSIIAQGTDISLSPASTKKIGELYGVSHIGVLNVMPTNICFRIINCENAENVAVCTFSNDNVLPNSTFANFALDSADLFVHSLQYALKEKSASGNQRIVYLDITPQEKKEVTQGEKKILYQRRIYAPGMPCAMPTYTLSTRTKGSLKNNLGI